MKKLITFLALSIIGLGTINAQLKPSFGFKAGANFTNFDAENNIDDATGFHAGVVLHIPLGNKFGLQPEAIYSFSDVKDAFTFSTIDVPLLLTYKLVPGLRVNLGPQLKIDAGSSFDNAETDAINSFESLNFDALAGLEYRFPVIGIFLQARYKLGITDIVENGDIKENGFLLSAGYRF